MTEQAAWQISYNKLSTGKKSYGEEALLTIGNGFLGWRGAPVFSRYNDNHYPGLYAAGIFNQTSTPMAGRDVINEDFVNLPNPQLVRIYVAGEEIDYTKINTRDSQLDFKTGQEVDHYTFKTNYGLLSLKTTKVVDPVNFHLFGLNIEVMPEFDAPIRIESIVDANILNQNVERYRSFDSREFDISEIKDNQVEVITRQSKMKVRLFAQTTSTEELSGSFANTNQEMVESFEWPAQAEATYHFSKIMGLVASNELTNYEDTVEKVKKQVYGKTVGDLIQSSFEFWKEFWRNQDIVVENNDSEFQSMVRLNIFHLQQAASHNANQFLDASVSSRALTGEGYRGHIFWDEIFFIPYYAKYDPAVARDLLFYRIRRLQAAQKNATLENEAGAMYPWQSGMYGDEQAQVIHLNPVNNEWEPDNSRLQRHVSLAIAYNFWYYYHVTNDASVLNDGALKVILEITKFWLNKSVKDANGRFDISGVMGPDEFHEAYPNAKSGGFKDNAYTNIMVAWLLDWVLNLRKDAKVDFAKIQKETNFDDKLLDLATQVRSGLNLEIKDGILAQFSGYFDLKELDLAAYAKKYGDIHRIDRLLKAEGKSPDDYQVAKQADALMSIYTIGAAETKRVIEQLGYDLPDDWLKKNTDYYLARTTHGSTTSRPVFAEAFTELDRKKIASEYLTDAIFSDFHDIQGGTTAEGIHIGVMGEVIEVITAYFAGVSVLGSKLAIKPVLPAHWHTIKFNTFFKGVDYTLSIKNNEVKIKSDQDAEVTIFGELVKLTANHQVTIVR